jgi:flagellar basal-body rod protein FlgC
MDLSTVLKISAAGLSAQQTRMRVVAENIGSADTTASKPGEEPYKRKMVAFRSVLDREMGGRVVKADRIVTDKAEPRLRYDPSNPAADEKGYVKQPNINTMIEAMDMRQAQRSYEANLSVIEIAKNMISRTIDILRG